MIKYFTDLYIGQVFNINIKQKDGADYNCITLCNRRTCINYFDNAILLDINKRHYIKTEKNECICYHCKYAYSVDIEDNLLITPIKTIII